MAGKTTHQVKLTQDIFEPLKALSTQAARAASQLGLSVFLVGGSVRDLLENRLPSDWDLVVFGKEEAGVDELASVLAQTWGVREPVSFPRFGTYLVLGPSGQVEIAHADRRTGLVPQSDDPLVRDALSRDFTINALYMDLEQIGSDRGRITVLDPAGNGLADLSAGLLKTPLNPLVTLGDDPLRILRAARLRSTTGYQLDRAFGSAARRAVRHLTGVATERVRDELEKIMVSERPSLGLSSLGKWGAFSVIAPEIHEMVHFRQRTPHHYPSLFNHTLRAVDRVPPDPVLRWAALTHDCGKPAVRSRSGEVDRYFGHESTGAVMASELLTRLKFGKQFIKDVTDLVGLHMVQYDSQWTDRAIRRFMVRAGDHLPRLLVLLEADASALRLRADKLRSLNVMKKKLEEMAGTEPPLTSPLDGERIMDLLNVEAGPVVGQAKDALVRAVVDGDLNPDAKESELFLLRWFEGRSGKQL